MAGCGDKVAEEAAGLPMPNGCEASAGTSSINVTCDTLEHAAEAIPVVIEGIDRFAAAEIGRVNVSARGTNCGWYWNRRLGEEQRHELAPTGNGQDCSSIPRSVYAPR
jgi:hypothetical protein